MLRKRKIANNGPIKIMLVVYTIGFLSKKMEIINIRKIKEKAIRLYLILTFKNKFILFFI